MKILKIISIWILGILITVGAAVFQRMTGPTTPYKEKISLADKTIDLKLSRSLKTSNHDGFLIKITEPNISGIVYYRTHPSNDVFVIDSLQKTNEGLFVPITAQKAAGKIMYQIILTDDVNSYESPFVIARYKNPVPSTWLTLHILFMFIAMLCAVVAGLKAIFNHKNHAKTLIWSGVLLFIGGMILGCIVQKYAFGVYWSGVPFGWDLTDNKTLLIVLLFAFAIWRNYKKTSRLWTIIAATGLLFIYFIPHSLFGSELDHETGKVTTAKTIE